jgi:hypothetical protein
MNVRSGSMVMLTRNASHEGPNGQQHTERYTTAEPHQQRTFTVRPVPLYQIASTSLTMHVHLQWGYKG